MSKKIENYLLKAQIGQGAYGNVFKGTDCRTGETVAIKQIALSKFEDIPKLYELTMNEVPPSFICLDPDPVPDQV